MYKILSFNLWEFESFADRGAFADGYCYDDLGDPLEMICASLDGNVTYTDSLSTQEEHFQMLADWEAEGLIYPDSVITDQFGTTLMQTGVGFSFCKTGEGQVKQDTESQVGYEVLCVPIMQQLLATSAVTHWGSAVAATSKEPEAAIRFLNLCYTNGDVLNLMTYGVEGTDYVLTDDGEASFDSATFQWHGMDWPIGNMFLTYPIAGCGGDFRDRRLEIVKANEQSPFMGFSIDTSALSTQIAQITSVTSEYRNSLRCGLYTETFYRDYISALETAGIEAYVSEVQAQLDAWLAANGG